jgi:Ras-related protein Rab-1A
MSSKDCDHQFKILTLGETQVGKTSILIKYTEGTFSETPLATIGVDFQVKKVNIQGKQIEVQIWDSAGQEKYRSISKQYYNRAQGILLVYDITNRDTFSAMKHWIKDIENQVQTNPQIVLIGNKLDLPGRTVDEDEAIEFAKTHKLELFETSAKTGEGIDKAMNVLIQKVFNDVVLNKNKRGRAQGSFHVGGNNKTQKDKKCC